MSKLVELALPYVIGVLGPIIMGYVVAGIHQLFGWLKHKVAKDKFNHTLDILDGLTSTAVSAVEQSVVDVFKKHGNWNDRAKQEALDEALKTLKLLAGDKLGDLAKAGVEDIDAFLKTLIEAKVKVQTEERAYLPVPKPALPEFQPGATVTPFVKVGGPEPING